MCSPRLSPMAPINVAESLATARPSMRTFQTLVAGRTGQAGAPGRLGAPALPPGGGVGVGLGVGVGFGVGVGLAVGRTDTVRWPDWPGVGAGAADTLVRTVPPTVGF